MHLVRHTGIQKRAIYHYEENRDDEESFKVVYKIPVDQ